jgi:predicted permease
MFLAQSKGGGAAIPVAILVGLKLILQPAVTALIVYRLIPTPQLWADSAVLLSALPTGTGPVMLAGFYRRETGLTSRVVLISTLISIAPLTLLLGAIRAGWG